MVDQRMRLACGLVVLVGPWCPFAAPRSRRPRPPNVSAARSAIPCSCRCDHAPPYEGTASATPKLVALHRHVT